MRNFYQYLCLALFCIALQLSAQSSGCEEVRAKIYAQFQKIDRFNQTALDSSISLYDSLKPANETLKNLVVQWIEMGGFKNCALQPHSNMKYVISPDLGMVAISWNTYQGGTMIDYASILGYQNSIMEFKAKRFESDFQGVLSNDRILIDRIYSIKNKFKENVYFVSAIGQGSVSTPFFSMTAYKIKREILEEPIFDGVSRLSVDFDYTDHQNQFLPEDFIGIQFLKRGAFIRRPISEKNGIFNGRFEIYKFDGAKYRRIK